MKSEQKVPRIFFKRGVLKPNRLFNCHIHPTERQSKILKIQRTADVIFGMLHLGHA